VRADAGAQQLVDLDEQVASELGDEGGGEAVRTVAAIGGRDERARVGDDPQSIGTGACR
jgi:hypothetical protein